ncbi:GntR family transcriptional regulator [Solimonas marina]
MPGDGDATPRYLQLARKLADAIQGGSWKPGDALPPERVLCEELKISRVTLRMALDAVEEQGLIARRQGAGTFVTRHIEHPLTSLTSFTDTLRRKGYEPGTHWLERQLRPASAEEIMRLGLSPQAEVSALTRLRSADGKVIAYERSVLPRRVLPDPQAVGESLYGWLDAHGMPVVRALQYFRAVNVDKRLAGFLEMKEGAAILRVMRIGYARDGVAIELTDTYCHGDYYDFVAELNR